MQTITTSDGIVIVGYIEDDVHDTWKNHDAILDTADTHPGSQIFISDFPAANVNNGNLLELLAEGMPENINVSSELWAALKPENFKKIRKNLLKQELGSIIGNGDDNVERAKVALEILSPHGMEDLKVENGKIFGNVDNQDCQVIVSIGRTSGVQEENIIYDDQIGTNLRLTVVSGDSDGDNTIPIIVNYDGKEFTPMIFGSSNVIYIPYLAYLKGIGNVYNPDYIKNKIWNHTEATVHYQGRKFVYDPIVKLPGEDISFGVEYYVVEIDGRLMYHDSIEGEYQDEPTDGCCYRPIPSLTLNK